MRNKKLKMKHGVPCFDTGLAYPLGLENPIPCGSLFPFSSISLKSNSHFLESYDMHLLILNKVVSPNWLRGACCPIYCSKYFGIYDDIDSTL